MYSSALWSAAPIRGVGGVRTGADDFLPISVNASSTEAIIAPAVKSVESQAISKSERGPIISGPIVDANPTGILATRRMSPANRLRCQWGSFFLSTGLD